MKNITQNVFSFPPKGKSPRSIFSPLSLNRYLPLFLSIDFTQPNTTISHAPLSIPTAAVDSDHQPTTAVDSFHQPAAAVDSV